MRNVDGVQVSSAEQANSFGELLNAKRRFLENLFGLEELEIIRKRGFLNENSFDINPKFESAGDLRSYWKSILAQFAERETDLSPMRGYSIDQRAQDLIAGLFSPSDTTGLSILMVGCYHVSLFNRDDVVKAAQSFLDATQAEDYMLITACNEEVMFEETCPGTYENKFLELITSNLYADRVFPIKLPERPEFHFSGRFSKSSQEADSVDCHIGFETHHYEGDVIRTRVEAESEQSFRLAFRSFARYVTDPARSSQCVIERNLKSYKKHLPQFFYAYRQLPPYLRDRVRIDFSTVGAT